jgi:large subunit ribosomal protein L9
MKLILTEDIPRLGSQGDVVNVKDGYGRNYLIPSGKALPATPGNLAKLTDKIKVEEVRLRKDKRLAEEMAERLGSVSCTIRVQADEHDKLYGAVHERDVAQALADQGIEIDPNSVVLEEPLKMLGVYPVKLHLFKDVDAEIKVWIIRE